MKFRKKPVVIEAIQWTGKNHRDMFDFLTGTQDQVISTVGNNFYIDHNKVEGGLIIKSPDGEHIASINDFIIQVLPNEFYPCKPDIFEKIYELVI